MYIYFSFQVIYVIGHCLQLSTGRPRWHWLRLPDNLCCLCAASINASWYSWRKAWEEMARRTNLWRYQRWIKEGRNQVFIRCSCSRLCPLTQSTIIANRSNKVHCGKSKAALPVAFFPPCVCLFVFFPVVFHTGNARLLIKSWRGRMRRLSRPTVSGYLKLNFDV